MPNFYNMSADFVAGITILFFIIVVLALLKKKERIHKKFDSTSPIVNIKRVWKGVEIVILNRKRRDEGIYQAYIGFVFIPIIMYAVIKSLSPLEKNSEEKLWWMFLHWFTILLGVIWICSLFYKLYGDTHIIVKDSSFIVKNQINDFGISFKYKFHNISNLYMSNPLGAPFGYNIGIDYKGETIKLIDFLTETEAKFIITELQKHIDISPIRAS